LSERVHIIRREERGEVREERGEVREERGEVREERKVTLEKLVPKYSNLPDHQ